VADDYSEEYDVTQNPIADDLLVDEMSTLDETSTLTDDYEQELAEFDHDQVEVAAEESTEQSNTEPAVEENDQLANGRIDLHDALLSDELYSEWAAEDEAAEEPLEEIPTETFAEEPQELAVAPASVSPQTNKSLNLETLIEADLAVVDEQPTWDEEPVQSSISQSETTPESEPLDTPSTETGTPTEESQPIARLRNPNKDVLVSTGQPVIVSHVEGPSSILVGQEASYRVILENTSRTAAENLSAVIHVPEWADLVSAEATSGEVEEVKKGEGGLDWKLPELAAHSSHTIHLRLIPRSGRKFQLGVQWNQDSVESQATVEVREPKLEMKINGPQEVLFGSPQRYQLSLSNPGTASAEEVSVRLIPPGSDASEATTHTIGTIAPGDVKEFELELTAREAGDLFLQANATAAGGLEVESVRRVLCRKPELKIDWRGPDQKYAGTETVYYFRVRNTGNASTKPIEISTRLPEGITFLSASDSYAIDSNSGVVSWKLLGLKPGEEQFVQFKCQLNQPGINGFDVSASSSNGEVYDSTSVLTKVIALADLKLTINDPQGARPIGESVLYEIRVENRGTTDAHGISIVGLFSEGIDPVSVEGAQNSVRDGRVTFQPVKSLPAGGEVHLKIRAVASRVGTHIFRAEVVCDDLDIRLAAEETTRFFEDEFHWDEGETPYTAEKSTATRVR
jgi:hypothetical protein